MKKLFKKTVVLSSLAFVYDTKINQGRSIKSRLLYHHYMFNYQKKYFFDNNPKLNELHLQQAYQKSKAKYLMPKLVAKNLKIKKALDFKDTYYVTNQNNTENIVILYLCGGSFFKQPSIKHLKFISELATHTATKVIMPVYPKAPTYSYQDIMTYLLDIYQECLKNIKSDQIIIMGDEAGATIALALANEIESEKLLPCKEVILLAPLVDLTLSDPMLEKLEKVDPIIDLHTLRKQVYYYAKDLKLNDKKISPLFQDLDMGSKISVFAPTYSITYRDALKLKAKALKENINIDYFQYPYLWQNFMFEDLVETTKFFKDLNKVIHRKRVDIHVLKTVENKSFTQELKETVLP